MATKLAQLQIHHMNNIILKEIVSLHPIAPGPVLDLSYEKIDTSINIAWKPPKEPNGDIVAYLVEHGVCNSESTCVRVDQQTKVYCFPSFLSVSNF